MREHRNRIRRLEETLKPVRVVVVDTTDDPNLGNPPSESQDTHEWTQEELEAYAKRRWQEAMDGDTEALWEIIEALEGEPEEAEE